MKAKALLLHSNLTHGYYSCLLPIIVAGDSDFTEYRFLAQLSILMWLSPCHLFYYLRQICELGFIHDVLKPKSPFRIPIGMGILMYTHPHTHTHIHIHTHLFCLPAFIGLSKVSAIIVLNSENQEEKLPT